MAEAFLPSVVAEAARRFGDAPALVAAEGWPVSYAHLHRRSDEAAVGLARTGVAEGDVVALVLPSTPDHLVAYLALAKLGAVAAPVNPVLLARERAAAVDAVGAEVALATRDLSEGLPAELDVVEVTPAERAEGILSALAVAGADPPPLAADADRPVALVLTSGTTGAPKAAWFADRQLAAVTAIDVGDRWGGGGPMVASTQFAHVGFMTKLAWYLRLGATTYLLHRWRAADVLGLVARHRMAAVGGVAPQVALLLRVPDFDDHDLSAVTSLVVGGGPSSPALLEQARRRFDAGYSIRYSSTESGGVGTGTALDADDDEALHSVGRPRPRVEAAVLDDARRPVPPGEVGEVALRSGAVMAGYWGAPEATAAALADGWLRTGDLGSLDDRGLLRLAGRADDSFVRGGENVHPLEVEAVLGRHPAVADVAVVARPDPVMGHVGVAVVVPRGAEAPAPPALRRFAEGRLARFKLPEELAVVDALPLTAMAKLDRRSLVTIVERATQPAS